MAPITPITISTRRSQTGLALLVALIVLVAMSLAGVALIRSVDTNSQIASNLAFRESGREGGDAGVEAARNWLLSQSSTVLENNSTANGYFATRSGIDLTGNSTPANTDDVKWKNNNGDAAAGAITPTCLDKDSADNLVCYVVQRMCDGTGAVATATCDTVNAAALGMDEGGRQGNITGDPGVTDDPKPAAIYRVTVASASPRNNMTFIQVFLAI
jgi:Tfp pilus assembly protein PilX